MSLIRYDFDEYVIEDVEWLLGVLEDRETEAETRAKAAREEFDDIRDQILKLPGEIERAETKISSAKEAIDGVNRKVHQFRKAIGKLRDELGLFDENSDIQLFAARKALDDERAERSREVDDARHERNLLEAKIRELENKIGGMAAADRKFREETRNKEAKLVAKVTALQEQIDGLPPTWQERILVDSGTLPEWAVVGVEVESKLSGVTGVIKGFSLDFIQIETDMGELSCSLERFLENWRHC